MADSIRVRVVYAQAACAWSRALAVPGGTTAAQAVEQSGFFATPPEVSVRADCLGVFGRRVQPGQVLRDGDRVEIYRPLLLDPMEARRRRTRSRG